MKKIFHIALIALLGVFAASCTNDSTQSFDDSGGYPGRANRFTFVLPAQSGGPISYAGEVPATENEKKLDLANTAIFMFDNLNVLEAIVDGAAITAGKNSAGKTTATIDVPDAWVGNKTFYMVGNIDMDATDNLPTAGDIGTMTSAEFLELTTVAQSGPIASDNGLLLAGWVAVANIEQSPGSNMTLYRSVARFDVSQDITTHKVKIVSIDVTNANTNGYITAYGRGIKPSGLATGDLTGIAVNQATVLVDVLGTPADNADDHVFQQQEALFYLYPTHLKTDGSGTTITLVGDVNGQEAIYTLNKEASDLPVDCEIKANTRYTISAIDQLTHTFTITIAEWDEGDDVVGRPGDPNLFGLVANPTGSAVQAYTTNVITVNNAGGQISFTVKASSERGTYFTLESTAGPDRTEKFNVAFSNANVISYGVPYYASTYTIDVEEILSGAESTVTMTIFDTKNPNNTIEIELFIAEVIGGIPLEEIFTDPALCAVMKGLGLPDIITNNELAEANITTLDIQNNTAIQSLEGIQYLDKLTDLLANGCSKLTGVLDFSSKSNWRLLNLGSIPGDVTLIVGDQPNLINLSVESSNIKNLDVSECPLLEIINIGGTEITEIDLLQNPELTHAHFVSSKLTELDLSNNIDLKELHTDYSLIETIILPDETPALTTLDVKNSAIRELVAGVAPLLYNLSFRDCSQLETIDLGGSNSMTYMEIYSVYNSSLKHVRIGTFPKLASITIKDHSNIESIEIESTEVLTTLSVYNNPLLETLTLPASLPKLTTLAVHQTALEELDLPYLLPELTALNVSNTELEQFDIGIADKLTSFGINNCPSLEELIIDSAAALTELDVTFAIIENISLNGCPALKTFRVGNMDDDNTVNYGHRLVIHMESIQSIDFDVMDVRGFEIAMFYVHDDINVHSNTPEDFFETLLYTPTLRVEIHNTRGVETYEYGY